MLKNVNIPEGKAIQVKRNAECIGVVMEDTQKPKKNKPALAQV